MTREIKFRAWDNKGKYWYPAETIKDFFNYLSEKFAIVADWFNKDAIILEQYTGLKDKNGKEIYEGDIVKCWSQDTYPVGRVMYSEEWCDYEIVSYDPKDCIVYNLENFSPTVKDYLEVIGNIHENPDLLK